MPGLVPGIHALFSFERKDVDGRVILRQDGASRLLSGNDESNIVRHRGKIVT
jgi:hypothetical protein